MQLILKFIVHSFKIVIFAETNFGRTMTKAIIRYLFVLFVAFLCIPVDAQNLKWRDMYQVKKKDTLFGIAKNFGLTLEELINANPEMKVAGYELKKGDYIFIPYPSNATEKPTNTVPATKLQPQNTARSASQEQHALARRGWRRKADDRILQRVSYGLRQSETTRLFYRHTCVERADRR